VLLISCITTPYRLAFADNQEPLHWTAINYTIDGLFLLDIVLIFNTAFYDPDY
jgi:hypothetical protein